MLRRLKKTDSFSTTTFGGFSPYWAKVDGEVIMADTAEEILSAIPENDRLLDPIAAFETLHWSNPLGQRTMVSGVQRMPWRATLLGDGTLTRRAPIPHGERRDPPDSVARNLRKLLAAELLEACVDREQVILTLTGGLDSRVVAGVLKTIERKIASSIRCVTWGTSDSRDVAYARRIAHWFDWDFTHLPYEPRHLEENLGLAARWGGAEITGLHLHRFPWFAGCRKNDLVIMASYGDSVGRAEFAGKHLTKLQLEPFGNRQGLFDPRRAPILFTAAEHDRATAWEGADDSRLTTRLELHSQENFMRRGVGHAADYVRQFCDLHQAFTSDAVASYMWSIDPQERGDAVYDHILRDLDRRLFDLPWARTGVAPSGMVEPDSSLTKNYHRLPEWLANEVRPTLTKMFAEERANDLGVLYGPSIKTLWAAFRWLPRQGIRPATLVSKIATIRHFCRIFGVKQASQNANSRPLRVAERVELAKTYGSIASRVVSRLVGPGA